MLIVMVERLMSWSNRSGRATLLATPLPNVLFGARNSESGYGYEANLITLNGAKMSCP